MSGLPDTEVHDPAPTTEAFRFEVTHQSRGEARTGRFFTPHGTVETPAFMPVGTRGTVRGVLPRDLAAAGSSMILANTYHLHLRPGEKTVAELGGLHRFMGWDGPILTDSGGYQVFSLRDLRQIDEDGVSFKSIIDGSPVRFTPEGVMDIQADLGADVIMAFDHCPADPHDRADVEGATARTHRWLDRCVARWKQNGGLESGQALFGIIQGGAFSDLRQASVEHVCGHELVGYAIGGVSVGEGRDAMRDAVATCAPAMPADKPRYLMGVGTPLDFFDSVERGADLFDCVTPTRHARTHQVFTSQGLMNVRNQRWKTDDRPLDPECDCPTCRQFSRGVLRHLAQSGEMLAGTLLSLHNLHFFHGLMARIRQAIVEGTLGELREATVDVVQRRL